MKLKQLFENVKVFSTGGVSVSEVEKAEKELSVSFPEEYKELLVEYGAVSVGTHEIAALGVEGYLNVVELTKEERVLSPENDLEEYIVIQNIGSEGMLIVLDSEGNVYEYVNGEFKQIYKDFFSYLKMEVCV
ncbi:hypothetical protein FC756_03620 [Lysinibacillus mangiferihumi]|uniref:Knr4/Smi1-like domain-containing protein n=1 Tax=Lysinibacillus mangiferihumi TaxID=1130819 RepID=A0A4U2ZCV6_9BACI|nr:SMI1/KNR4 family protein [Lysinibacillus mangiferihumi]TKI71895.1 hypothetical protein FC756_03620 [Lysinibacillus mangiferihumi]